MERATEPKDGGERELLLGWLAFHRDALAAKCEGVSGEDLVAAPVAPSNLSLLGLVRHMTEMERVYLVYALGGGELVFVYGPYEEGGPERDFEDLDAARTTDSVDTWHRERARSDELIAAYPDLDTRGAGNGYSVRWNLIKLIEEYARHNGHADLIRESIDGVKGE